MRCLQKAQALFWENWFGIETRGLVGAVQSDCVHYSALPYGLVFRILKFVELNSNDVFLDIGSGKGRMLCCAAQTAMRKVIGVELNGRLVTLCRENLARARGIRSQTEVWQGSATEYSFGDETVIYLFNPFHAAVMQEVLLRLEESLRSQPREIRIIYAYPTCEELFNQCSWLEKYAEWSSRETSGFGYPIAYYRTVAGRI